MSPERDEGGERDQLIPALPFDWSVWSADKALVIGVGGGADGFSARAVANELLARAVCAVYR